ncbi:MAG: hypothetical protein AAGK33_00535 [Pseudomonadota bacterium]
MKIMMTALVASAFMASPALACGFGKMADHKEPMTTASTTTVKTEEAMSTFDPSTKPVFDTKAEATPAPIKKPVDSE